MPIVCPHFFAMACVGDRLASRSTATLWQVPHPLHRSLVHTCGIVGSSTDVHRYMLLSTNDILLLRSWAGGLVPRRELIDLCTQSDRSGSVLDDFRDGVPGDLMTVFLDADVPRQRHYLKGSLVPLDPLVPDCLGFEDYSNSDGSTGRVYRDGYVEGSPRLSPSIFAQPSSSSSSPAPLAAASSLHSGVRRSSSHLDDAPLRSPHLFADPPASASASSSSSAPSLSAVLGEFESAMQAMDLLCEQTEDMLNVPCFYVTPLPPTFLSSLVSVRRTRALYIRQTSVRAIPAHIQRCAYIFSRAAAVQAAVVYHNEHLPSPRRSPSSRLMQIVSMVASRHVSASTIRDIYMMLGREIAQARFAEDIDVPTSVHPVVVARSSRHASEAVALAFAVDGDEEIDVSLDCPAPLPPSLSSSSTLAIPPFPPGASVFPTPHYFSPLFSS